MDICFQTNMKPKISIIGPSHRTHLWRPFYESIVTDIPFEVIFVSDIQPKPEHIPHKLKVSYGEEVEIDRDYSAYDNFKWILSPVKPAQCFEIAYRQSQGEFIIWTGDDFVYSPFALDHMYAMYRSFHDHKVMISADVYEDGHEATKSYHKVPWNEKIQLTTSALISKRTIQEVGGLGDINFVAGHFDVDLQMRIYANGGRMFVCPGAFAYEPHNAFHKQEANFAIDWKEEYAYFEHLWRDSTTPEGIVTNNRKNSFIGYTDENILTISQGNVGKTNKWRQ